MITLSLFFSFVLCCHFAVITSRRDVDFTTFAWNPQRDVCDPGPKGRVPWIIHVRDSDYGWGEHTHRANIALAVNEYRGTEEEIRKMALQLEVEVTRALFRNSTSRIHENDLGLFIHALLATHKNPRNFYGNDLVADLLHRVETIKRTTGFVHPFLVLVLCNSRAVTLDHLMMIKNFTNHDHDRTDLDGRQAEMKALTLKAFACAADLNPNFDKFRDESKTAADCLRRRQNSTDGSFGNVYTTSLAVQALIPYGRRYEWLKEQALSFLERESTIEVNLIKAYYIEMALNAERVPFIKSIYRGPPLTPHEPPTTPDSHYIQYTIKEDPSPDYYFTLTLRVPLQWNFFDIMLEASNISDRFGFLYYENKEQLPMVYSVAGRPNDAEENMFWRICRQRETNNSRHQSVITPFHDSPVKFTPLKDEHILFWYRNSECPQH